MIKIIIKRTILLLCSMILCISAVMAEEHMASQRAWITPGSCEAVTVNLVSENHYRGFECTISSLESNVIEGVSLVNDLADNFTIISNKIDATSWRIATYSITGEMLPMGNNSIFEIMVAKPHFPSDETLLQISNVTMATADNREVNIHGCLISVNPYMEAMSILPSQVDLQRGEEYFFKVETTPSWSVLPTFVWASSDPERVTVDAVGRVEAIATEGEVTITAEYNDIVATSKVFLHGKKPKSFIFDKPLYSLEVGKSCNASLIIDPVDADVSVSGITVDNTWVATISKDGVITALSEGDAHLKATLTYEDQIFEAEAEIVVGLPKATAITLDCSDKTLKQGDSFILTALIEPVEAPQVYSWAVDSDQIVSINANENICTVAPLSLGKASISVKTTDGSNLSATCSVEVIPADIYSVKILPRSPVIAVNETYQLTAVVLPENALDKDIYWSVSDPSIATIDKDGVVHPVSAGNITVTARCGNVSDEINVLITERYPDFMEIVLSDNQFVPGHEYTARYVYAPENITINLEWEVVQSDDIIEYSINGSILNFKCLTVGDVKLIVRAGEKTVSREIKVRESDLNTFNLILNRDSKSWTNASRIFWEYLPDIAKIGEYKVFVECKPIESENEVTYNCSQIPDGWTKNLIDFYTTASLSHDGKSFKFAKANSSIESNIYPKYISEISFWHRGASVQPGNQLILEGHSASGWENIETIAVDNSEHDYQKQISERKYNAIRISYNKVANGNIALDDIKLNFYDYDNKLENGCIQHPRYWDYSVGMTNNLYFVDELVGIEKYFVKVRACRGNEYIESNSIEPLYNNTMGYFTPLNQIILDNEKYEVAKGKTITLVPVLVPSNCSVKGLIWSVEDETVAIVEDGVITGVSNGNTRLTITPQDNSFTKPITVNLIVSETNGIEQNIMEGVDQLKIYNLHGVYVGDNMNDLSKGIYIVRQGSAAKKVVVK